MDNNSFTSSLPHENEADLSPSIQLALSEIRKVFTNQEINALQWSEDKNFVVIPMSLNINLPTRGTVNNVEIRKKEPIFLLLDRKLYPYKSPIAWSDRRDFPKEQLPHLNPKRPGSAANFCLHRGSIDTWFSEHNIIEYIQRIQEWLSDAASGRLIKEEDGFEATRIDESTGYCIYEPSRLQDKVQKEWQLNRNKSGFCIIPYILLKNPEQEPLVGIKSSFTIKVEFPLKENIPAKMIELQRKINSLYDESSPSDRYLFGILAWPPKEMISDSFFADLPDTFEKLVKKSNDLGIPLESAVNSYLSNNLQLLAGIPVTLVISRPQNILNSDSNLELLNFVVQNDAWIKSVKETKLLESKVSPMRQRSPLTIKRANEISSSTSKPSMGKVLFLGCGAIGSKVALHLVKSGRFLKITFIDNDEISPHNLIRHGLLSDSLGKNKALALKDEVENIYYADKDSIKVAAINDNVLNLFFGKNHEILSQHTWLIDATASSTIRDVLVLENLPTSLLVCRCEIADNGKLGFMSIEGFNRNPRLDDLLFYIFDLAVDKPEISNWLKSTKEQRDSNVGTILEEISIGISCNSETMRLSDDCVSFHASLFSLRLQNNIQKSANNHGILQISYCDLGPGSRSLVQSYDVAPVSKFKGENDKSWQTRVTAEVRDELMECLRKSGRNETGGLLLGQIDPKKKIIYVTRILLAPPDSKSGPYAFERGVQDVPEDITRIFQLTGGMIDYVGEWHTHPNGGKKLSIIDSEAIKKIKKVLDPVLRPTFVMIVTKEGLYPYIFSTGC